MAIQKRRDLWKKTLKQEQVGWVDRCHVGCVLKIILTVLLCGRTLTKLATINFTNTHEIRSEGTKHSGVS